MALKPSNAVEWLQAERLAGNEWAVALLDLLDGEDEANENANAIEDLRKKLPDGVLKLKKGATDYGELWRLVEYYSDRLDELGEIQEIAEEFGANVVWPNGTKPSDTADKLRAMLESGHWLQHDL